MNRKQKIELIKHVLSGGKVKSLVEFIEFVEMDNGVYRISSTGEIYDEAGKNRLIREASNRAEIVWEEIIPC